MLLNNQQPQFTEYKGFLLERLPTSEVKVRVNDYKTGKEIAQQETVGKSDEKFITNC